MKNSFLKIRDIGERRKNLLFYYENIWKWDIDKL